MVGGISLSAATSKCSFDDFLHLISYASIRYDTGSVVKNGKKSLRLFKILEDLSRFVKIPQDLLIFVNIPLDL